MSRYWSWNVSGSRSWPFKGTWRRRRGLTSSVTWSFDAHHLIFYRCSFDTNLLSLAACEILSFKHIWNSGLRPWLSGSRDVINHVIACPWAISSRCSSSIGVWYWYSISKGFWDIEAPMSLGTLTILTFLGHVTSSVTCSFFPRYVVCYRCSVDTSFLTGTVTEIFGCKGPINIYSYVKPGLHFPCVNGHIAHCTMHMRCYTRLS